MLKPRNYISFSSFIDEKRWFTQIDLELDVIYITSDDTKVWEGSIAEFKMLEKIKAKEFDKVYASLLDMAEELIALLSKK